jgi:hypothetical protein
MDYFNGLKAFELDSRGPLDYPGCQCGTSLTPPTTKSSSVVTTVPVI